MNLDSIYKTAETALWSQTSFLSAATYVRPPALSKDFSVIEVTETAVPCSAMKGHTEIAGVGSPARKTQQFLIRASELTAILVLGRPRKGDYIVDADQTIFAVYAAVAILGGRVWKISAQETADEDFGSIAVAHTNAEDRGDLTTPTAAEDYGPLYT
jgi:hypothetical protein